MKATHHADVAVIGAGIVGLALAYCAARKGKKVVIFERNTRAVGASIRNFGLLWPVGQAANNYDRALRSLSIWKTLLDDSKIWYNPSGSLHLAYHKTELDVLEEFSDNNPQYNTQIINPGEAISKGVHLKKEGLLSALWSATETTVDPREVISKLPFYLESKWNVALRFGRAVTQVIDNTITLPNEHWQADQIFVCSGADFETLYPNHFDASGMTKCKLQMMRTIDYGNEINIGPSLCAGLTLGHYASFQSCTSLSLLKQRFETDYPDYVKYGIHVLVSQHASGALTIGDSHEYGQVTSPFNSDEIDNLVLQYLSSFMHLPNLKIAHRWEGIYPKLSGKTEFVIDPEPGVTIVNGLGGAGMTLSFGLAEELISKIYC